MPHGPDEQALELFRPLLFLLDQAHNVATLERGQAVPGTRRATDRHARGTAIE